MRRISTPTAAQDLFGPGKHGFRNGDPQSAVMATRLDAEFFNAVQEEIAGVVEGVGDTLAPADNSQLFSAIKKLFRSATVKATELLSGVLRVGTQAEVNAGVLDDVSVTPKKLRWGFAVSLTANGYVALPSWLGGIIFQWGVTGFFAADSTSYTTSFPLAYPNACFSVLLSDLAATSNAAVAKISSKSQTGFVASQYQVQNIATSHSYQYFSIGY